MKDKKTIGFDILDNARLDEIERIGTNMDILDEKTKKRILEMTRKRYNDAIKGENTGIYDNAEDVVDNVEVYSRKKSSKIIMSVVNTAAALGLAVGSVFMVKNLGREDNNIPDDPLLPSESTTFSTETTDSDKNPTQEEIARNKRIEDYIQDLYESYGDEGENFYESLKIDYAYLDINNDSIDELFIRFNLYDNPEFGAIDCNYFDRTEYIPFTAFGIENNWKLDLQNRKYYTIIKEKTDENDYCELDIYTWENVEISHESDYFTLQDSYYSGIDPFIDGTGEHVYLHNFEEPCTKEEYDKAIAEYENCVGAELKFIPYDINIAVFVGTSEGDTPQTETAITTTQKKTTTTTTQTATSVTTTIKKPTQEVLDKARDAALKARFDKHDKNYYASMSYAYYDINDDSVPELLISNEYNINWEMEIYKFNGAEFEFKTAVDYNLSFKLCKSEKLIEGCAKSPSMAYSISRYDDELNFSAVDGVIAGYNFDENGNMYDEYRFNDKVITKEEYESYMHNCEDCIYVENEVQFTHYYTNDPNYNENRAREMLINEFYSMDKYEALSYFYPDLNSDGILELVVLGIEFGSDLTTVGIYQLVNGEYVFKSEVSYSSYKLDMNKERIYYVSETNGEITDLYIETWDENCDMIFVANLSAGDEGFNEYLKEYESREELYFDYHNCW